MTHGLSRPSANVSSMARSRSVGEMLKVSASTSTNTGVAPSKETISAEAKKVKSGTNTASPGPMPHTFSANDKASVPLAQVTQWLTPT